MKNKDQYIIPGSHEHLTFNHKEKNAETSTADPDLWKSFTGNFPQIINKDRLTVYVYTYVNYLNKKPPQTGDEDVWIHRL